MTEFQELIKEVFIDPIRSVLIIDDQYPTWEEILNTAATEDTEYTARSPKKNWHNSPGETLRIIRQFQQNKPGIIIDIHDASDSAKSAHGNADFFSEGNYAVNLHQSDLLILDYNLEGTSSGLEGRLARNILKSVLFNNHYNLVIIHTQEDNLLSVFSNCLVSLSVPLHKSFNKSDQISSLRDHLANLSDEEIFDISDLREHLDLDSYIKIRHPNSDLTALVRQYHKGVGPLYRLAEWAHLLNLEGAQKNAFVYWAIEEFEKTIADIFSDIVFEGLDWSVNDDRLWLRTSRGFVTIIKKDRQDLFDELQLSLADWKPTPSRLLSAKVRHEISCNGVDADDRTLSRSHVFAYFYSLINKCGSTEKRAAIIREHLDRQTEALTDQISPEILRFGEVIFGVDTASGNSLASSYGVDLSDENVERHAAAYFNSYISTLPLIPEDNNLSCGHIFQLGSDWWVCATPACDMEPGQNTIAFTGQSDELRPFTALKLSAVNIDAINEIHVNSGLYCFVEAPPGNITCLGLRAMASSTNESPSIDKVTWRTLIAKNEGRLVDCEFDLIRPKLTAEGVELLTETAQVKARLRYEYALNYIQKVGASMTRIGLGYRSSAFKENR